MLVIFGVAWLSAALLSWFVYAQTKKPKTEKLVRVAAAVRDMPAGTRLKKTDLKTVEVPERDLPKFSSMDDKALIDRVLLFPINANEPVVMNKLAAAGGGEGLSATIEPGKRAFSVPFTDATGAAGLIGPRSHVDVYFTRPGSMTEAATALVLEDVVVLSVGRVTEVQATAQTTPTGSTPTVAPAANTQTRAATLLVTPEEAAKLDYCRNQGKLSLALRNPLDRSRQPENKLVMADTVHPELMMGPRKVGRPGVNLRDPRAWANLTGGDGPPPPPKKEEKKEPPKPRLVVDVFRGDKHVQEIFQ